MKYPNSVQKTLIAKLIGITRDQVKVFLFLFLFLYLFISTINRFGFKIEDVKIQSIHNMELEEIIKKVV
jgi:cell division septal protein FtsQ